MPRTSSGPVCESWRLAPLLFLVLIGLWTVEPLCAGQEVRSTADIAKSGGVVAAKSRARHDALADAVLREALDLLPGTVSEARKDALRKFLDPQAETYIQNYSEKGYEVTGGQAVLTLDVTVKRQALKALLQRLGVSYASNKPRPYVLTQKGLEAADLDILRRMQLLSGLQTTLDSGPTLHIERLASGQFSAGLSMTGRTWNETSQTLEGLWALIWGDYFGSAPVKSNLTEGVTLELSGQGDPEEVREVELTLARMDKLVDGVRLASLLLTRDGFKAKLTFRVINRELLTKEVSAMLKDKKMSFVIADN